MAVEEVFLFLPIEILIFHVFSRLCVKSVLRCMCVCKSWHSILTGPEFAKIHLHRVIKMMMNDDENSYENRRVIMSSEEALIPDGSSWHRRFPSEVPGRQLHLLGSCHGLMCVLTYELALWNPSTGKYKVLPNPIINDHSPIKRFFGNDAFGFCYDSSADDYKVVHVSLDDYMNNNRLTARIYAVKSNSWKELGLVPFPDIGCLHLLSPFVGIWADRTIYWLLRGRDFPFPTTLLGFHLDSDTFTKSMLSCPGDLRELGIGPEAVLIRLPFLKASSSGSLHLIYLSKMKSIRSEATVHVWRVNMDTTSSSSTMTKIAAINTSCRDLLLRVLRSRLFEYSPRSTNFRLAFVSSLPVQDYHHLIVSSSPGEHSIGPNFLMDCFFSSSSTYMTYTETLLSPENL